MFQQKIQSFFDSIKGKNITILGIGVSHLPLIKLLAKKGACVTACDKRESIEEQQELLSLGVTLKLGENYLDDLTGELIFKTPGMRYDHPALVQAVAKGSKLTSEMEVFFELCPCTKIAVTGSDGKTTTTTLISEMLKEAGYTVHLGGNIGKPLLPEIESMKDTDIAVVELSSFQLHTMRVSPEIAVVTNLSPNHLDMHKSMEEYVDAKRNICRYQGKNDLLVLNLDNDITLSFASQAKGRVRFFSMRTTPSEGLVYNRRHITSTLNEKPYKILSRDDIRLPGDHNVENFMAAIAAVRDLVSDEHILNVARNFGGVKHRIEFVREVSGVRFYNDSIGSSPTRTMATLRSFDKRVHLLAGGYDKKLPFDEFGKLLPQYVKKLYLCGHTAEKIADAVKNSLGYNEQSLKIYMVEDYKAAVEQAYQNAKKGDIVVLSPACASFDAFKNFEVRGEYFINCVKELKEKCNDSKNC